MVVLISSKESSILHLGILAQRLSSVIAKFFLNITVTTYVDSQVRTKNFHKNARCRYALPSTSLGQDFVHFINYVFPLRADFETTNSQGLGQPIKCCPGHSFLSPDRPRIAVDLTTHTHSVTPRQQKAFPFSQGGCLKNVDSFQLCHLDTAGLQHDRHHVH